MEEPIKQRVFIGPTHNTGKERTLGQMLAILHASKTRPLRVTELTGFLAAAKSRHIGQTGIGGRWQGGLRAAAWPLAGSGRHLSPFSWILDSLQLHTVQDCTIGAQGWTQQGGVGSSTLRSHGLSTSTEVTLWRTGADQAANIRGGFLRTPVVWHDCNSVVRNSRTPYSRICNRIEKTCGVLYSVLRT
jgi:hypothetical protein